MYIVFPNLDGVHGLFVTTKELIPEHPLKETKNFATIASPFPQKLAVKILLVNTAVRVKPSDGFLSANQDRPISNIMGRGVDGREGTETCLSLKARVETALVKPKKMSEGLLGKLMYKNRLQEYTQKSGIPLPEYQVRNEGFQHAPKFRSRVLVEGEIYESRGTFPQRKEAEQDAARVALEHITQIARNEESSFIQVDPTYCKLILNEYAIKMRLEKPEYKTTTEEEIRPVFISTLVFDGRVYKGEVGKSKKMAEQLAAHVAIRSLLETGSEVLNQIIKSKRKVNDSVSKIWKSSLNQGPGANKKVTNIMPSTPDLNCQDTNCKCSGENKRKPEAGNWEQKKNRCL